MPLDTRQSRRLQRAMASELGRAMKGLQLPGNPRPFFISHLLHVRQGLGVWGRYGAIFGSEPFEETDLYSEVRVGSYRLDQSIDGGLLSDLAESESFNWIEGPQDLQPDAIRYCFWKLTQMKYEEALQEYYDKRKILVEQHLKQSGPTFSHEPRYRVNDPVEAAKFPVQRWENYVRDTSGIFRQYPTLIDPYVRMRGLNKVRIFVNSEGSRFVNQEFFYETIVQAWQLTRDGVYLSAVRNFYGRDAEDLPGRDQVHEAIDEIVEELRDLSRSRPLEPYAGPALLGGIAAGLLFHEAIGHRLEGERLVSRSEGHTFAGKIGKRILPEGVDIVDDPSLKCWEGQSLYGYYDVDDEGVRARPVALVEDGILKNFLLSRACIAGFRSSNGHGRQERYQDPMARMANLLVRARDGLPWNQLKERLLEETARRGLPYGIIVKGVSGGETRTDRYDFQAFKGIPTEVYTVDPKTGRETRVRDVSFIGTPLAATQRILAFGRDYAVDNSYCFAESGSVPVATIAPPMLVGELELQRSTERSYRAPILPAPPMERHSPRRRERRRAPR